MKLPLIIDRIKAALPSSPIAVFRCSTPDHLDAVFAETVLTRALTKESHYIGEYHRECILPVVQRELESHVLPESPTP